MKLDKIGLLSDNQKKKWLIKSFKSIAKKRYKEADKPKVIQQYELIKSQYLMLGVMTEEDMNEIEKEMEDKYKK